MDMPDHHTVGLPIYSSEEEIHKKRYSIVNDQEHQLIKKMQHQHIQRIYRPCALSVISQNNNIMAPNGRIYGAGPYDSWTPSQLLHEQDEQHSDRPYDDINNQGIIPSDQMMPDQYSLINGGGHLMDHMSMNGAPPVPPLPYNSQDVFNTGGSGGSIYGTNSAAHNNIMDQPPAYISSISQQRHLQQQQQHQQPQFNTSLQGSMNSVNSNEKKKTRNVTMV